MSVQAVSGRECSSQMSLFWMALIDRWSAGTFKMCSTLWCLNNLECCQPPVGVSWCSGYSLRWHYCVQGFTVARVMWVERRTTAPQTKKNQQNKTKQQNSHVVTVVVTVISSTSSPRLRRHATESRRSLAGSLWRIPAPVRACLEPSDRIPARLSAVDEDARLTDLGFCHWAGTGTQRGQRPRRGGSMLTCIKKSEALSQTCLLHTGNSFNRQSQRSGADYRLGQKRCQSDGFFFFFLPWEKFSTASTEPFKNGWHPSCSNL